ncbi:glycine--tRNA ligase subunit beta [Acidiferrobacter sp.]|uniref:glycine--tRNA ligase subunit beta n=1 Tax=Acidiferrobacter sp. TaxID=1872107 RepID=UPI00263851D5|nr:glycine--tRNA ligase subunit beta [Acidiferrobacter sp.]
MAKRDDLLLEIGTEELPPGELMALGEALAEGLRATLSEARLLAADTSIQSFASPRRIAARITGVAAREGAQTLVRRGPALAAAFTKEGAPTGAAQGFARSLGVGVEALERIVTDKGEFLGYRERRAGRPLTQVLTDTLEGVLQRLPARRRMRWGAGTTEFVRPVHWVVALHGARALRIPVLGVMSGRHSRGHRFHAPRALAIPQAAAYEAILESEGRVIAGFAERRRRIGAQIDQAAARIAASPLVDGALLDLVTALVEWPHAVLGSFGTDFLEVPREALIAAMQGHQKYFPLEQDGRLLPHFITIANVAPQDDEAIRKGNERVLAARFADARFFWDTDGKRPLAAYAEGLSHVAFEQRLGSLADKTERLTRLARMIAGLLGVDPEQAARAGALCKADLLTGMVSEFPELQGIMGGHYARRDGEHEAVATAIADHYRPRFAGDDLPRSALGMALALADKLDTLVGIFGIGLAPTGDKDPFALRRAAIGALRLLEALGARHGHDLSVTTLLEAARAQYPAGLLASDTTETVRRFLTERLRNLLEGSLAQDAVAAALAGGLDRVYDAARRARALLAFTQGPAAAALIGAHKRIRNILRQNHEPLDGRESWAGTEEADKRLAREIARCEAGLERQNRDGDYEGALASLGALRPAVDAFFEDVLVMSEDADTRRGRLHLLTRLAALCETVGDLSCLKGSATSGGTP